MSAAERAEMSAAVAGASGRTFTISEVTDDSVPLPARVAALLDEARTEQDVIAVLLHALALEVGYEPVTGVTDGLPAGWKRPSSDCYGFRYHHPTCPDQVCAWVAVPMGPRLLLVHGYLETADDAKFVVKVDVRDYVHEFSRGRGFRQLPDLSRLFKDEILYKTLARAQSNAGVASTFGLGSLCAELKLHVLGKMDARSLTAMASVNREWRELADTSSLWRRLYLRDFGQPPSESAADWKQMYKRAYLTRKAESEWHSLPWLGPPRHRIPNLFREDVDEWFRPPRILRPPRWPPYPPLG